MEELVMPSRLALINDEVVEFTMPYVPNINFQEVLDSKGFSHEEKVVYLKDIYCYIVMIFNYFYGDNIGKMSLADFYTYLEYLNNIGVSKEFLDAVEIIYSPKDNVNPCELLDEMAPFYERCHQNTFELVRKMANLECNQTSKTLLY